MAFSLDDARTWSKPVPSTLPNSNTPLQAAVLGSGALLVVFNNVQGDRQPWPLSAALSEDGGQSWPWVRDLETKIGGIKVGQTPRSYRCADLSPPNAPRPPWGGCSVARARATSYVHRPDATRMRASSSV